MNLTRRGWTALVVVAASMALAWQYGPRALNAVVTPLLVVLVAALVTVVRTDRPEIRRAPVADGHVGDRRTVELTLVSTATASATVRDAVPGFEVLAVDAAGTTAIDPDGNPIAETTLGGGDDRDRIAYDVRLEGRGEHRLGPATVTVSDVFGLVYRRFTVDSTTTVLVYPRVHPLRDGPGRELRAVADPVTGRDREAFDHLREYRRGDSLRDVHWKSAAKRPDADLVVTEYTADEETGTATIAAECAPGRDDELARAVASVATHLLEAGVDVGLALPGGDREPGSGRDHRADLLAALARLEAGELEGEQRERADLLVRADEDGTRIVVDGRTIPFAGLVAEDGFDTPRADSGRDPTETDRRPAARDRPDDRADGTGVAP